MMKHGQNNRRSRQRGNGKRYPNQRGGAFESSGPDVKVRGTAQQVFEKYLALARDAAATGDRIASESYMQHAEHYYRIITAEAENGNGGRPRPPHMHRGSFDDFDDDAGEFEGGQQPAPRADTAVERRGPVNGGSDGQETAAAAPENAENFLPNFISAPAAEQPAEGGERRHGGRRGRHRGPRQDRSNSESEQSSS